MDSLLATLSSWLSDRDNRVLLWQAAATTSVIYLALVRYLRYRYINELRRKYPDPTIALKDPAVAEEVFDITARREFPLLARQALELALFKTYSVPSISKILHSTGEFSKDARKRVEDTELLLLEINDVYPHVQNELRANPNVSQETIAKQRARRDIALQRMNELHGKYAIRNGDYLYTLSLFIAEPIKWINKYEWRKLDPIEEYAIYRMWYDTGLGMNLKDIPDTLEKMIAFHEEYGKEHVRYAESNWKVAHPTVELLLTRLPKFTTWFMAPVLYKALPSLLDPLDVKAFGLPEASPWMTWLVDTSLYLRALFIRHCMLPRFSSRIRTPTKADKKTNLYKTNYDIYGAVYPNGYCIQELGPEKFKPAKCPIPH